MTDDLLRLSRMRVTADGKASTLSPMSTAWPVEEFQEYLRALMDEARIANFGELSRLTGVSENQFSRWKLGKSQPSAANLRRIAPALDVAPVALFIAAGLNDPAELDLDQPDLTVVPAEIRDLISLYGDDRLKDEQRSFIRQSIANLTAGLRAHLAGVEKGTSGRRRTA